MRATEARLTNAIVAVRNGDLDGATEWARTAYSADRRSVHTLSMVTEELHNEARSRFGQDPAFGVLNDVIQSCHAGTVIAQPRSTGGSVSSR